MSISVHAPTVPINLRAPSQASGKARRGPDAERTSVREHRTAAGTPPEAWIGARPRQDRERLLMSSCTSLASPLPQTALVLGALLLLSACPADTKTENGAEEQPADVGTVAAPDSEPCTVADPCEEAAAAVEGLAPDDPRIQSALVIDARSSSSFESWRLPRSRNVTYDFLEPTPITVAQEIASAGEPLVAVYGDGDDPDSGEALARELAGYGVENVFFIEGGAPALREMEKKASRD